MFGNVKNSGQAGTEAVEINKFNMYFIKEIKKQGNEIQSINENGENSIKFSSGNKFLYDATNKSVKLIQSEGTQEEIAIEIAKDIERLTFASTIENETTIITVTIKPKNSEERVIDYILGSGINTGFYENEENYIIIPPAEEEEEPEEEQITLPSEYVQVEYIKLDDTSPYTTFILTNIAIKDISSVVCKYEYENFNSVQHPMFLSAATSSYGNGSSAPYACTDGTKSGVESVTPIVVKTTNMVATEFTVEYNNSSELFLKIGGWGDNYWTAIGKYYYVKIFDKTDNMIFNGIPCYRESDNEPGLYDLVSDVFYTNQGTGAGFTLPQ